MKKLLLILLLAPFAKAEGLSGSAVCASEENADYNFQFAWDDYGQLSSVTLFKQQRGSAERRLLAFQVERDTKAFVIAPDRAVLDLAAPTGEKIKLNAKIDDHGIGSGTLDWQIPQEHFNESNARAMCSF